MMAWEEKLAAFKALGDVHLEMRAPGDWYVADNIEIADNGLLIGEFGNGETPQKAVEDHWQKLVVDLAPTMHLYARVRCTYRRVRWNGFMWADVKPPVTVEEPTP